MLDLAVRLAGTVLSRPYVFAFFAAYLLTAVPRMGWIKTALFSVLAWAIAFAAEYSSTRTGFPFGMYHYIDTTRTTELWISNVPFWDSLSFVFLTYVGFSVAISLYSPLVIERDDFQIAETRAIRRSWRVLFTGAILTTLLDVVIDPLSVRGERWFLGKIYYYPEGGIYFGVPISNFLGWFLVGAVTIGAFQRLEEHLWPHRQPRAGIEHIRCSGLFDVGLYFGVLLFNVALTFWIGEPLIATVDLMIFLPVVVLMLAHPLNPDRRATLVDIAAHCRDFPHSALARRSADWRSPSLKPE